MFAEIKYMTELLSVKRARDGTHKYVATFLTESGRLKHTSFGAAGMDDYTLTGDKEQRERYRKRHRKDLLTDDPTAAGYLSYYILWGPSRDVRKNIALYKSRFNV